MARDLIIVDSCVLIKAFRKDSKTLKDLQDIRNQTAYSVVTQLELLFGANTKTKKEAVNKIFDSYYGIHLTPEISSMAIQIMETVVTGQRIVSVPDCLIAATAIVTGFPLLTYNKKDFEFIVGVIFYK